MQCLWWLIHSIQLCLLHMRMKVKGKIIWGKFMLREQIFMPW